MVEPPAELEAHQNKRPAMPRIPTSDIKTWRKTWSHRNLQIGLQTIWKLSWRYGRNSLSENHCRIYGEIWVHLQVKLYGTYIIWRFILILMIKHRVLASKTRNTVIGECYKCYSSEMSREARDSCHTFSCLIGRPSFFEDHPTSQAFFFHMPGKRSFSPLLKGAKGLGEERYAGMWIQQWQIDGFRSEIEVLGHGNCVL